jgi:hypothetical protein
MKEQQLGLNSNNPDPANDQTINIFVPFIIKKRGGSAMIIIPKNIKKEELPTSFDEKMIKAFAKAYKWKRILDDGKVTSLSAIAAAENITSAYVSRVFNLNFISPKIVETIINGKQPRTLKLQDLLYGDIPLLWQEQEEKWGF